jgi:hypothetical protein
MVKIILEDIMEVLEVEVVVVALVVEIVMVEEIIKAEITIIIMKIVL